MTKTWDKKPQQSTPDISDEMEADEEDKYSNSEGQNYDQSNAQSFENSQDNSVGTPKLGTEIKPIQKGDLRDRINKLKSEGQSQPQVEEQKLPSENDSDSVSYHSDTFGEVKKKRTFLGKRKKKNPGFMSSSQDRDNTITEIPQMEGELSDMDSVSQDDKDDLNISSEKINMPENIIKLTEKNAYHEIQKIITESEELKKLGKSHSLEKPRCKLLRMCSVEEAFKRQMNRDLSIFEMDPDDNDLSVIDKDNPPRVKPEWAVKLYKRSAADVVLDDPETIRPIELANLVLDYLLEEIADVDKEKNSKFLLPHNSQKHSFKEIYVFLFDRTRAIRQELVILGQITSKGHVELLEKIARFHCLAANEGLDLDCFNVKQNSEQFTSTMTTLRESYDLINSLIEDGGADPSVYQSS
jgi:hypothetical protein